MNFRLVSPFKPTGDQPEAIKALAEGVFDGVYGWATESFIPEIGNLYDRNEVGKFHSSQ